MNDLFRLAYRLDSIMSLYIPRTHLPAAPRKGERGTYRRERYRDRIGVPERPLMRKIFFEISITRKNFLRFRLRENFFRHYTRAKIFFRNSKSRKTFSWFPGSEKLFNPRTRLRSSLSGHKQAASLIRVAIFLLPGSGIYDRLYKSFPNRTGQCIYAQR